MSLSEQDKDFLIELLIKDFREVDNQINVSREVKRQLKLIQKKLGKRNFNDTVKHLLESYKGGEN